MPGASTGTGVSSACSFWKPAQHAKAGSTIYVEDLQAVEGEALVRGRGHLRDPPQLSWPTTQSDLVVFVPGSPLHRRWGGASDTRRCAQCSDDKINDLRQDFVRIIRIANSLGQFFKPMRVRKSRDVGAHHEGHAPIHIFFRKVRQRQPECVDIGLGREVIRFVTQLIGDFRRLRMEPGLQAQERPAFRCGPQR